VVVIGFMIAWLTKNELFEAELDQTLLTCIQHIYIIIEFTWFEQLVIDNYLCNN